MANGTWRRAGATGSIALAVMACGLTSARADPVTFRLYAGYEYSSGTYGATQATELQTSSFSAKASWGGWAVRVYVPYLVLHGPSNIVVIGGGTGTGTGTGTGGSTGGGGGGEDVGTPSGGEGGGGGAGADAMIAPYAAPLTRSASGIGDTTLRLSYTWNAIGQSPLYAALGGLVRLPSGSYRQGLGVGTTDYGTEAEIGGQFDWGGVYATAGYRFRGNHIGNLRRDGLLATAGTWIDATDALQVGAYYDWRERVAIGLHQQEDIGAYAAYRITSQLTAQIYGENGFTTASPDYDIGVRLSYSL